MAIIYDGRTQHENVINKKKNDARCAALRRQRGPNTLKRPGSHTHKL